MAGQDHIGTYQGYPVQATSIARRPSTRPDFGVVDLSIDDFKKVVIRAPGREEVEAVPWKDDTAGGHSIATFDGLRGRRTRALAGDTRNPTPEDGFFSVGDLILQTLLDEEGKKLKPVVYRDIYLAPGGFQEITDDIDNIKPHDKGTWRIPVTDIRAFWKYGIIAEDINVRLDGGNFDPNTTRPNTLEPWPMNIVVPWLLSLLPGSITVDGASAILRKEFKPPENIFGRMSPAVAALDRVLSRAGLQFSLLPNNTALISEELPEIPQGQFFDRPGKLSVNIPFESYERKSFTLSDRPPLITVAGAKRVRSIEAPYVPIFQDSDGRYYPLSAVQERWKYSIEDINKVVFVGHEKAFADIPGALDKEKYQLKLPPQVTEGEGRLYFERRRIAAKCFYKMYGPVQIFQGTGPGNSTQGITEKELQRLQYMPMFDFLEDTGDGETRKSPPQVYGFTIKQDAFKGVVRFKPGGTTESGPTPGAELEVKRIKPAVELERAIDEHLAPIEKELKKREKQFEDFLKPVGGPTNDLSDATAALLSMDATQLSTEEKKEFLKQGVILKKNLDFSGQDIFSQGSIFIFKTDNARFNEAYKRLAKLLAKIKKDTDLMAALRTKMQERKKVLTEAYDHLPAIEGWLNQPRGLIPASDYSLDKETGIITFSEVTGSMTEGFVMDRESVEMFSHGFISVRYGFELETNSIADWTAVNFQFDEGSKKIAIVGFSAITGIKAHVERDPNLRAYEDEDGKPLNRLAIVTQALPRAQAVARPRSAIGFIYELAGFHPAIAQSSDVQYIYDGDKAQTIIAVNLPNAILPLGNQKLKDGNKLFGLGNDVTWLELP